MLTLIMKVIFSFPPLVGENGSVLAKETNEDFSKFSFYTHTHNPINLFLSMLIYCSVWCCRYVTASAT